MILTSGMGQQRSHTREMPKLSLRASFEPKTVDVERRTVELVWTTGSRVLRGMWEPFFEELSLDPKHVRMGRLQSGKAPLLNSHNAYAIEDTLGVVESARLEKGQGTAVVRFDSGPAGEDAFRRVREGTLCNVSVGYSTFKMQKIEGGSTTTPVYRAIDWEPAEISLVSIPADAGAVTRSGGGMTPCEFIQESNAMDPENPNPTPTTTNPPQPIAGDGQQRAAVQPHADAVRAAEARAEERILGIQRIGRKLNRPESEIDAAIKSGTTLDAYRTVAIDAMADAPADKGGPIPFDRADPRIAAGEDARDKWNRGAEAWLLERSGMADQVAEAAKNPRWSKMLRSAGLRAETNFDAGEFRGARMMDLARQALELSGKRTAGMLSMDLVGAAFMSRSVGIGGAAATGDFPILLENTLNKILLSGYAITPNTWERFCKRGSVSDFRASKRYRKGSFGVLSKINEGGEFTNKAIPDGEKQSLTAGTKGNVITLSRQAIVNDDMNAFSSMASDIGMAAALTIESDVYALLAANAGLGQSMDVDGLALFHATHKNIGVGAALGSNTIDADRVLMGSQTDPSGNQILAITPTILLVPLGLEGAAKQINNGAYDFDSTKFQIPNKVGGLFRDIIGTARLTGTRRYLFADPGMFPTIEVAFLEGQAQPFLDVENGWRTDGVEWKVRMDYGVAPIDFRGAVTNAGA